MMRFYLFALLFLFTAILSGSLSERYRVRTEEIKRLKLTTEEIIKHLPSGIITIDRSGDVVFTNVNEENIRSVVHLYLVKFLRNPEKIAKTTELEIGRRFYLLSCARIGNIQGALGVLQDLTDIRRLEETSRISKQTKILAELGGSLAHEIRNPLSSIRGSLEVISKGGKRENINRFIGMALKESNRLNEIVTDFLNFAQFVPKKMNRVRIHEVITEAILEIEHRFSERNIRLVREGGDFICRADLTRLKSGIANILGNAYEVSSEGQKILVRTSTEDRTGTIEITDHGPGIAKKDLKQVFVPFYTTKKGGTGLGLAIAQKIIEAHDGHIEVLSRLKEGATFKIILPLA
jgi:two-component system sensor histidine kinase PilS (NtrC family)